MDEKLNMVAEAAAASKRSRKLEQYLSFEGSTPIQSFPGDFKFQVHRDATVMPEMGDSTMNYPIRLALQERNTM